jgi:hypothetical protein
MAGEREHNGELDDLYSMTIIIRVINSRKMRWTGHVPRMGEKINACRVSIGKRKGKRPLGRSKCRWVYNIKKK